VILVTGGSGLVGQHLRNILTDATYISSSNYDLTKQDDVEQMMKEYRPDIVIHLAARVGGMLDNMNNPVDYLEENILMNTNVLKACHNFNVKKVITMLSTCIYPDKVKTYPMKEEDLFIGPPTPTNFSYGFAKRCMATHIDSYIKQYDKKWCYLIPCNLYGEYDKYEEHNSHFVSALIRKIYEADDKIELWGTGEPLRQFMYGGDLARVIKYVIDNDIVENLNVGTAEVYSIDEIVNIAKKACGKENLVVNYDNTKPDGQFRKDVDSSKLLSVLKDFEFTPLEEGIKKVYDNFSKRYNK
jgi:GDP-L-fucose synthase